MKRWFRNDARLDRYIKIVGLYGALNLAIRLGGTDLEGLFDEDDSVEALTEKLCLARKECQEAVKAEITAMKELS